MMNRKTFGPTAQAESRRMCSTKEGGTAMKAKYTKLWGALALGAGLCAAGPGTALAQSELVLGFLTAETGPFVSLSRSNEIGARIAVDEINAAGGVNGKRVRYI